MPDEYKADFVGSRKPPKIVQRKFGSFPGLIVVAFHFRGVPVAPGGILGFGITTTKTDSGKFGEKEPA